MKAVIIACIFAYAIASAGFGAATPYSPTVPSECAYNESTSSVTTSAIDTAAVSLSGSTWTMDLSLPAHWQGIDLISPADCGGGRAWTCGAGTGSITNCVRPVQCTLADWVPEAGCGASTGSNGELIYVFAPNLNFQVDVEDGSTRNLTQVSAMQVTYQTTINATLSFDALGVKAQDFYLKSSTVSGLNEQAVLDVKMISTLSWPYYYTRTATAPTATATNGGVLGFVFEPAELSQTGCHGGDTVTTCEQTWQFKAQNTAAQGSNCYLSGSYTFELQEYCQPEISGWVSTANQGPNCPQQTLPAADTYTLTIDTSSVCVTQTISVTLSAVSLILQTWDGVTGTGELGTAFVFNSDVYFYSNISATNGQYISTITHNECYLDKTGTDSLARMQYWANGASAYDATEPSVGGRRDVKVLKFTANAVSWGLAIGESRTMTFSCQYVVVVQGTVPTRRRLLQASSGTVASTPFQSKSFTTTVNPAPTTGGSTAMTVSPTVAALAVLGVVAAVLVGVLVRQRKKEQREKRTKETEQEMTGALGGSRADLMAVSSSTKDLQHVETQA